MTDVCATMRMITCATKRTTLTRVCTDEANATASKKENDVETRLRDDVKKNVVDRIC